MYRRFVAYLALVLAAAITLSACAGQVTQSDGNHQPSAAPNIQTDPIIPKPTDPTEPDTPGTTENPEFPEDEPYLSAAQAMFGASADGYGVWTVSKGLTATRRLCIDSQGFVAFEIDKSETDVAGVYHNSLLLKVNYEYYILRSVPDGKMVFDSANTDGGAILLPEHNGKAMFRDGYLMVMRQGDAQSASFAQIGFMNPKGEWIQPLAADNPILSCFKSDASLSALEKEISYLGEGIVGFLGSDQVYRYYDINSNAITAVTFPDNISKHTMYDALDYDVRFIDGVSDPVYLNNNYYLFYSTGKITAFNVLWPYGLPRAVKCGNPYFDRATKLAYFLYDYADGILLADSTGKIIKKHPGIKLKEYAYQNSSHSACQGFASDGLARLIVENDEGICFYAVVNSKGQFQFDPVMLSETVNTVFDLEGFHIDVNSSSGSAYYVVIDNSGRLCYESEYVDEFSVNNGVARVGNDGEDYYINVEPESEKTPA